MNIYIYIYIYMVCSQKVFGLIFGINVIILGITTTLTTCFIGFGFDQSDSMIKSTKVSGQFGPISDLLRSRLTTQFLVIHKPDHWRSTAQRGPAHHWTSTTSLPVTAARCSPHFLRPPFLSHQCWHHLDPYLATTVITNFHRCALVFLQPPFSSRHREPHQLQRTSLLSSPPAVSPPYYCRRLPAITTVTFQSSSSYFLHQLSFIVVSLPLLIPFQPSSQSNFPLSFNSLDPSSIVKMHDTGSSCVFF
jgi:hypothetical protein